MSRFSRRIFAALRQSAAAAVSLPILSLCVLAVPAQPAGADEASSAQPLSLAPLVVTPTRLPTPEADIASSVTVITGEEMEARQERTLADALEMVPGLNVVQAGGPGQATQVYVRGTNANETKVLIDGIDVSDPSAANGTFDYGHILTAGIDRVEVLRGPESGLYGGNAIGGVINIITKRGAGPAQFTGSLEGGSFGTFNQTAGVKGSLSRFDYALDVAHFHSSDTPVTPAELVPVGRSLHGDAYDNTTVSSRLDAKLTDNFDVGLVTRYVDTKLDFTADDFTGPEALQSTSATQQLFTRATAHLVLFDGVFDQTLGLGFTDYHRRYLDPNDVPAAPNLYHGDRIKADWRGNITLAPGEVLTLGAEHQLDQVNDNAPLSAHVANDAGYLQLQSSLGDRFFNSASLRYDANEQFGGKTTWRIAPAFLIPETGTKLKATLGTGFNPPSLDQLFENFPAFDFFANPHLRPETSLGYDAGIDETLWQKRLEFGVTYFHNSITNLISINAAGTTYENIGKATTQGFESYIAVTPWSPLTLRADWTYTLAEDDVLHRELLRRPKNKMTLAADWKLTEKAQLTTTLVRTGPWVDVNRAGTVSGVEAKGYTTVNLAGSYDLGDGVTAFARLDNLFDRHYQDPLGFEHPGLGFFAGVRVALGAKALGL